MKKLLPIFALSLLLLCGCTTVKDTCTTSDCLPDNWEQENNTENMDVIDDETKDETILGVIENTIIQNFGCNKDDRTFVNFAILGTGTNNNGNTEYYIVAEGQGYYIDKRGNLSNSCGFGSLPISIEISEIDGVYKTTNYRQALDGSEFVNSIKDMFPEKIFKIRQDAKYVFIKNKSLLETAEEYYNTKIIPEVENNFECKFCDKLRYYNPTPEDDETIKETNELHFDYIAENNGKNTIYFGSDGTFEAKGSRDEGKGNRVFGKDENTVIVSNEDLNHVYDRYIITNVDENNLNTILEIIQK